MQKLPTMFRYNSFQSFNFTFAYFSPLNFKFIQLKYLRQLFLYITIDHPIFYLFFFIFLKLG